MSRRFHSYEPARGHGLAHDPLNSIVAPRPIGWISTCDAEGHRNLAPYSFFNLFNYRPPILGFASNGFKDSVRNAEQTGEFCWNLVTAELADAMNRTSAAVEAGADEFALAGLTAAPSTTVSAPRVDESPVSFECKVTEILRLKTAAGQPVDTWAVFGEAVMIHIDEKLLVDRTYRTALAEPILRGGGPGDYFRVIESNRFFMQRP